MKGKKRVSARVTVRSILLLQLHKTTIVYFVPPALAAYSHSSRCHYYVHYFLLSVTVFNNKVSLSNKILLGELAKIWAISLAVSNLFNST